MIGDLALDLVDRDAALVRAQHVGQRLLDEGDVDRPVGQHGVGDDAVERAFQLADVGGDPLGEEQLHLVRAPAPAASPRACLRDDREPQLEVGRVDVGDQPPGQARQDAALDALEILRASDRR